MEEGNEGMGNVTVVLVVYFSKGNEYLQRILSLLLPFPKITNRRSKDDSLLTTMLRNRNREDKRDHRLHVRPNDFKIDI